MSLAKSAARVVAAVTPELQPRLRAILSGCDLRFARTGSDLVRALEEAHCELMVLELHYDQAAALAALRCVVARQDTYPVVCVRAARFPRTAAGMLDRLRLGVGAAVAPKLIELVEHLDDAAGNAQVRAMLEHVMSSEPVT